MLRARRFLLAAPAAGFAVPATPPPAKPPRPALPTLPQLATSVTSVADHLLATQTRGFGASLVRLVGCESATDIDLWVPGAARDDDAATTTAAVGESAQYTLAAQPVASTAAVFGAFAGTVVAGSADARGAVHAGALATLADIWTSLLVWGFAGPQTLHVSVGIDLAMTAGGGGATGGAPGSDEAEFLASPRVGERLLCVVRVPRMGKQLAFTEFSLFRMTPRTMELAAARAAASAAAGNALSVTVAAPHALRCEAEGRVRAVRSAELVESVGSLGARCRLAHQASLVTAFGTPFATGTHEKAFITK